MNYSPDYSEENIGGYSTDFNILIESSIESDTQLPSLSEIPAESCATLTPYVASLPKPGPTISLPGARNPNAVQNTIKNLTKQLKNKLSNRPELLTELNSIRASSSGAELLDKLKNFRSAYVVNVVNQNKTVNATYVDNQVINNITYINKCNPNPGNWSSDRLAKYYALHENLVFISGIESMARKPAWLAQVLSEGRRCLKLEQQNKTETVVH